MKERALRLRERGAVGVVMMHQFVHVAPEHLIRREAKNVRGCRIHQCAPPVGIHGVDAVGAGRDHRSPLARDHRGLARRPVRVPQRFAQLEFRAEQLTKLSQCIDLRFRPRMRQRVDRAEAAEYLPV